MLDAAVLGNVLNHILKLGDSDGLLSDHERTQRKAFLEFTNSLSIGNKERLTSTDPEKVPGRDRFLNKLNTEPEFHVKWTRQWKKPSRYIGIVSKLKGKTSKITITFDRITKVAILKNAKRKNSHRAKIAIICTCSNSIALHFLIPFRYTCRLQRCKSVCNVPVAGTFGISVPVFSSLVPNHLQSPADYGFDVFWDARALALFRVEGKDCRSLSHHHLTLGCWRKVVHCHRQIGEGLGCLRAQHQPCVVVLIRWGVRAPKLYSSAV